MSRLSIEVSQEQHKKIKALAALEGKSMREYVLNKLFIGEKESQQSAIKELEELLLKRIEKAENSSESSITFQQITDAVLKDNHS